MFSAIVSVLFILFVVGVLVTMTVMDILGKLPEEEKKPASPSDMLRRIMSLLIGGP